MNLILVMTGGAIGAGARWLVIGALDRTPFPWGTLTVNVVGGLLMGLLLGWLMRGGAGEGARLFLGVGVLGGFTTFSAFGLDTWLMLERGQAVMAAGYVLLSVIGAVAATGLGLWLVRAA